MGKIDQFLEELIKVRAERRIESESRQIHPERETRPRPEQEAARDWYIRLQNSSTGRTHDWGGSSWAGQTFGGRGWSGGRER